MIVTRMSLNTVFGLTLKGNEKVNFQHYVRLKDVLLQLTIRFELLYQ